MTSLPFSYEDFRGGLNSRDAAYLLTDNQARDLLNVQGTVAGAISKRTGLVTFATPAAVLTSLYAVEEPATTTMIGAGGTSLYKVTSGGVMSVLKTGLTNGLNWSFVQAPVVGGQGPLFGMNGTDTPQQWDGAAGATGNWTALTGALPNGTMCLQWANSVWVTGVAAFPHRVYWSLPGDPTNWPAANVVDLDPNDGEPITGIGLVGPYLLVGKRHKLFIVHDPATGANRVLDQQVGIASHRSIAPGAAGTYFLSEDRGVYVTNGSKVTPISDNIQPNINAITARSQASGVFFQGHYYLSIPNGGGANNQVLDWDATLDSWWLHGFGSNQFTIWHPTGADPRLFSAKATAAIIDQCFVPGVFTDNGAAMPWVWRGPWQSPSFYRRRRFPTPYFRKRLRQLRVQGAGNVDFYLAKDFVTTESLFRQAIFRLANADVFAGGGNYAAADGSVWGDIPALGSARIDSLGVAQAFSLVFKNTSTTQDQILLYVLMLTDRKDSVVS